MLRRRRPTCAHRTDQTRRRARRGRRHQHRHQHQHTTMVHPVAAGMVIGLLLLGVGWSNAPARSQQTEPLPDPKPPAAPAPSRSAAVPTPPVAAGWSRAGTADVPDDYRTLYVKAASTCPRLTPWLLAGIGKVESDHGRSSAPGVRSGLNRFGCCAGPMQFNLTNGPPSTWDGYSRPGDSVYAPADAIPAAARKLCNDGFGPGAFAATWAGRRGADPCPQVVGSAAAHRALRRYNNACWYAAKVIDQARLYAPAAERRRVA